MSLLALRSLMACERLGHPGLDDELPIERRRQQRQILQPLGTGDNDHLLLLVDVRAPACSPQLIEREGQGGDRRLQEELPLVQAQQLQQLLQEDVPAAEQHRLLDRRAQGAAGAEIEPVIACQPAAATGTSGSSASAS